MSRLPLRDTVLTMLLALLLFAVIGCAKQVPQQVTDVNRQLSSAKDACASVYAEQELSSVQKQVDSMNVLADDGKYRKARKAAEPLLPQLQTLDDKARAARERAKTESQTAIDTASGSMDAARTSEAATYAADDFRAAEAKLAEAQAAMKDPCRYGEARTLAEQAGKMAGSAREAAVAEKARLERERELAEQRKREEEARRLKEEEERRLKMFPPSYTVQKGDSLWRIAGMERVYGDAIDWPILHDANRDAINNPDLIYPGQVLQIPRGLTEQQMTEKLHQLWGRYGQED